MVTNRHKFVEPFHIKIYVVKISDIRYFHIWHFQLIVFFETEVYCVDAEDPAQKRKEKKQHEMQRNIIYKFSSQKREWKYDKLKEA